MFISRDYFIAKGRNKLYYQPGEIINKIKKIYLQCHFSKCPTKLLSVMKLSL